MMNLFTCLVNAKPGVVQEKRDTDCLVHVNMLIPKWINEHAFINKLVKPYMYTKCKYNTVFSQVGYGTCTCMCITNVDQFC